MHRPDERRHPRHRHPDFRQHRPQKQRTRRMQQNIHGVIPSRPLDPPQPPFHPERRSGQRGVIHHLLIPARKPDRAQPLPRLRVEKTRAPDNDLILRQERVVIVNIPARHRRDVNNDRRKENQERLHYELLQSLLGVCALGGPGFGVWIHPSCKTCEHTPPPSKKEAMPERAVYFFVRAS